jgi:broad specificity phosphatase PhoE
MSDSPARNVLLVRHPPIDPRYDGLCYGQSDVELCAETDAICGEVADRVARHRFDHVYHSGLRRARRLAERIADRLGVRAIEHPGLRERDFGAWELRPWSDIFAETGGDMLRMITEPDSFRPGGGETTFEVLSRVRAWRRSLPAVGEIVAVSHGGPIATLIGDARGLAIADWINFVPPCGGWVWLEGPNGRLPMGDA